MAHPAQRKFFEMIKDNFPEHFKNVSVIDFGSLDVNGTLKDLFENSKYIGVDIHPGKNVDIVSQAHGLNRATHGIALVDTVVSGEMLEHDEYWYLSLMNMYTLLRPGGLIAISAAGPTRPEHGTRNSGNNEQNLWGTSPDYYKNITKEMIKDFASKVNFKEWSSMYSPNQDDIYFYGIKN